MQASLQFVLAGLLFSRGVVNKGRPWDSRFHFPPGSARGVILRAFSKQTWKLMWCPSEMTGVFRRVSGLRFGGAAGSGFVVHDEGGLGGSFDFNVAQGPRLIFILGI